jgi:hypothetical protein
MKLERWDRRQMKLPFWLALVSLTLSSSLAIFAGEKKCCWIDSKTGKEVPTIPRDAVYAGEYAGGGGFRTKELHLDLDPDGIHAHNPNTGQNFVRIACPPPAGAEPQPSGPSTTEKVLRTIGSSVNVNVGLGGGDHGGHDNVRRGGDDRLRTTDKSRTDDKTRTVDSHRTNEKRDNKTKIAQDPEITHDRDAADYHKKRKEELERRLHNASGPEEKKTLERQIKDENDSINKYQADLAKRGG